MTASLYLTRSPGDRPFTAEDQDLIENMKTHARLALEIQGMFEDESALREAAEVAERARSAFLSMISHDLRSPLAAIKYLTLVTRLTRENETGEQLEYLELIDGNVELMTGIVTNLLDMSRIESNNLPVERERIHLLDVVQDSVRRQSATLIARDREIRIAVSESLPTVYADPLLLGRVMDNLIINALKYSEDYIDVRASFANGIIIEVLSIGEVLTFTDRRRLFDRFLRGSRQAGDGSGRGLGLAICKSIIKSHGGEIGYRSDPGKNVFWFSIPADSESNPFRATGLQARVPD